MEIYNATGKTKSGELRVTRPLGALGIAMSQPLTALTNETITVYIERADGDNTDILNNISLLAFLCGSVSEAPAIFVSDNGTEALAEICENGAVMLQDTEAIKIKLDNLKSGVTYALHGIEYPVISNETVKWSKKTLLIGESSRKIDVTDEELAVIENISAITEASVSYVNGMTVKYTNKELMFLSRDLDPVKVVDTTATAEKVQFDFPTMINFPLVGVTSIDFQKNDAEQVQIYLKNDSQPYLVRE